MRARAALAVVLGLLVFGGVGRPSASQIHGIKFGVCVCAHPQLPVKPPNSIDSKAIFGAMAWRTGENIVVFHPSPNEPCTGAQIWVHLICGNASDRFVRFRIGPNQATSKSLTVRELKIIGDRRIEIMFRRICANIDCRCLTAVSKNYRQSIGLNRAIDWAISTHRSRISIDNKLNVRSRDICSELLLAIGDSDLITCNCGSSRISSGFNRVFHIDGLLISGGAQSSSFGEQARSFDGENSSKENNQYVGQFNFEKRSEPMIKSGKHVGLLAIGLLLIFSGMKMLQNHRTGWRHRLGQCLCWLGPILPLVLWRI